MRYRIDGLPSNGLRFSRATQIDREDDRLAFNFQNGYDLRAA